MGDDARIEARGSCERSSNIQYRWPNFDTSVDNDKQMFYR